MRRVRSLIPIVWLLALLVLPTTAYLVGVRQPMLENREKTAFPDFNRGTLRQEHTYQQIDAAIRERLPLRGDAISLRGRIAIELFGDSPTADVVLGKDRWLYYRPELRVCGDGAPKASPTDALTIVARTITASGRKPVLVIAGSKILTHDEHLTGLDPDALACVAAVESSVHQRLAELPGGHPIQAQLDALEDQGEATFLRSDTHWNTLGREVFANAVLDAVEPGLAARTRLRRVDGIDREGDLGTMINQKRIDRDDLLKVTGSPNTDFKPGELVFVGDSQFNGAFLDRSADGIPVFDHVFPGQSLCNWDAVYHGGCVPAMLEARTIVIESVARNLDVFVDTCSRTVSALAETVQGRPARWADGGSSTAIPLSPSGTPVRVAYDGDRSDIDRLIRIPVHDLATDPPADPASAPQVTVSPPEERPCATTAVSDDSALLIPVMAGERISDVALQAAGPDGARLGRPEVLVLDDTPLPARR